jgi:hypothetical protein
MKLALMHYLGYGSHFAGKVHDMVFWPVSVATPDTF